MKDVLSYVDQKDFELIGLGFGFLCFQFSLDFSIALLTCNL